MTPPGSAKDGHTSVGHRGGAVSLVSMDKGSFSGRLSFFLC